MNGKIRKWLRLKIKGNRRINREESKINKMMEKTIFSVESVSSPGHNQWQAKKQWKESNS